MPPPRGATVGDRYRSSRLRIEALLGDVDEPGWTTPVAACPGWRVRDVLAHLVGVIEDAVAGRLDGPPSEAQTAVEVERHRDDDPRELFAQWSQMAPVFEEVLTERAIWPGFFDVLSHEHDIRGALDRPGERDHADVRLACDLLTEHLEVPAALEIDLGDRRIRPGGAVGEPLVLRTTAFEVLRLRLGRRSRGQVERLDWSGDPGGIVDALFIFGPATHDIVE